jgi:hypothetical protein
MTTYAPTVAAKRAQLALPICIVLGAILYLVLFGVNSLTRRLNFSPDSMNYVDIARNINAGRGIVQNSLGFNQIHFSPTDQIPSPVTSQPPLYPLLIAAVSQFGIPEASASLLVAVFSYALGLLVAYLLARELYNGDPTALLSVSFLLNYYPLALVSSFAWSESVGIAIVLLFMWLLALRHRLKETSLVTSNRTLFVAGLAAGLAFSTRYGLLPVFLLGILVLLVEKDNGNQKLRDLTWYVVGFALPASAVLVRNYYLSRAFMGGNPNPSSLGPGDNLRDVFCWYRRPAPIGSASADRADHLRLASVSSYMAQYSEDRVLESPALYANHLASRLPCLLGLPSQQVSFR